VSVFYFGRQVVCCPTSVQAWDICKVLVSPICMGFCGYESLFTGQFSGVLSTDAVDVIAGSISE